MQSAQGGCSKLRRLSAKTIVWETYYDGVATERREGKNLRQRRQDSKMVGKIGGDDVAKLSTVACSTFKGVASNDVFLICRFGGTAQAETAQYRRADNLLHGVRDLRL